MQDINNNWIRLDRRTAAFWFSFVDCVNANDGYLIQTFA